MRTNYKITVVFILETCYPSAIIFLIHPVMRLYYKDGHKTRYPSRRASFLSTVWSPVLGHKRRKLVFRTSEEPQGLEISPKTSLDI